MKKLLILTIVISMLLLSSCDFVKDRFLDGDPLYGGGHEKGTTYTPAPPHTPSPSPEVS